MRPRLIFLFAVTSVNAVKDLDVYVGSGNISAKTEHSMKFSDDGATEKIRTNFSPYDSSINLGIRWTETWMGPVAGLQIGAELSYFGASIKMPTDRIVESSNSGKITSISSQSMTDSDRIGFNTGRGSLYIGFALPVVLSTIIWEVGAIGGLGLGRVNDATSLIANGRIFSAYTYGSFHYGINLRFRFMIKSNLSVSAEYRYLEERGSNIGSTTDDSRIARSEVNSNLFLLSIGYRYGVE